MDLRGRVFGFAVLCAAGASHGLVLGPATGAALIGRPLDLVIQVHGAVGEDASSSCFQAEVYHGDARQEASGVRVLAQAGAQPQVTDVRIASVATVDEPVVTVQVRSICGQKVTRQYVMLADLPSEIVVPSALRDGPSPEPRLARLDAPTAVPTELGVAAFAPVAASQVSVAPATVVPSASTQPVRQAAPVKAVPKKRPVVKAASTPLRPSAVNERSQSAQPVAKARLVLDSLEMLSDRVATLESATAEAMKPDLSTDALKVQTLESDVKALLALAAKNEASLTDLKARLQKAEAERLPSGMFYGLLALLLAGVAALGFWSIRQRQTPAWSDATGRPEPPESRPMPVPAAAPEHSLEPDSAASRASRLQAMSDLLDRNGPPSEVDVSLIEMSESNFDKLIQSGASQNAVRVPTPTRLQEAAQPVPASGLSADAVFDIRQQAEFFVSLGQTDRAIRVLEDQISATDAPNPLVYLDLLALLHAPSRKTDFRRIREDFNLLFNANAPEFAQFKDEGKGLEAYPAVLSAIADLWPDQKVLAVIEACILRDPWGSANQPFDLAAFRDLLLLHAMAQAIAALPASKRAPATIAPAPADSTRPDILLEDMGPASEIDVDLSDTHGGEPVTIPTAPA